MIGLGSNRLSVCRRGGMSVTQAGKGGMEWLGVRAPRWSSPYSAQATAALKAQFPTQWPTIRDYGFAHPEIVPYVNQYPIGWGNIIVGYQLCEYVASSGTTSSGQSINTGWTYSASATHPIVIKTKFRKTNTSSYCAVFGTQRANFSWQIYLYFNQSENMQVYIGGVLIISLPITLNTDYEIEMIVTRTNLTLKVNGTAYTANHNGNITEEFPLEFFSGRYGNTLNDFSAVRIPYFIINEGEVSKRQYYPCYNKTSGVIGMYDVVTNEFKVNISTGSFTKGADVYYPESPS